MKLTKRIRSRIAIFIALAYAFCILVPSAALALAADPASFHCLAEFSEGNSSHGELHKTHTHPNGAIHHHGDNGGSLDDHASANGKAHGGDCCGLFCMSALALDCHVTLGISSLSAPTLPAIVSDLSGNAPHPLHRPPII